MSDPDLPIWFPLQAPPIKSFKPSLKDIEELIEIRAKVYSDLEFDINFKKDRKETQAQYLDRVAVDRKSFTIMKMGVVEDRIYTSWFLEYEGDLFQSRFENSEWTSKKILLDKIYPSDEFGPGWLELEGLEKHLGERLEELLAIPRRSTRIERAKKSKFKTYLGEQYGMQRMIAIDFRYGSYHIQKRDKFARLYKGWVILTVDRASTTIKHQFQQLLKLELDDIEERIKTEASGPIKRLRDQINHLIHEYVPPKTRLDDVGGIFLEGTAKNLELFPPCVQELMSRIDSSGYIEHSRRFQLGLFLKHIGMGVEEQLRFWFNKAADNINITFEEFENGAGYQIRHLYGLEGSQTDYNMIACSKLQTSQYYCTFAHRDVSGITEIVRNFLATLPPGQQASKNAIGLQVIEYKEKSQPKVACAKYLELTSDRRVQKITFPLQYVNIAAKSAGKLKTELEGQAGSPDIGHNSEQNNLSASGSENINE